MPPQPKRVFLSYAWESDEFRLWVKQLATRLREDGIDARLDAWHLPPNGNIPEFMNREVREADWVLVLCSPRYKENVRSTEDGERVAGVGWESRLLTGRLLMANENKILAVLAKGNWPDAAPDFLVGQNRFDLSVPATFEQNYRTLLSAIAGTGESAPALGPLHVPDADGRVAPLRYDEDDQRTRTPDGPREGGVRSRWFLRQAPAILAVAVVIDLLLAWFVKSSLPFADATFLGLFLSLSPLALLLAAGMAWLARTVRIRRSALKV